LARHPSLDELWRSALPGGHGPADVAGLPDPVRRYREHAIAPGTPAAAAVRLRMHGEIKLRGWLPFTAEEVIHRGRGMIWRATVRRRGLWIRGSDRLVDGAGAMRWRLWGIVPVMTAAGPDITRSAIGRLAAELVWLPSVLCGGDVSWTVPEPARLCARLAIQGETADIELTVEEDGRLAAVRLRRWGSPEGGEFHEADFGGLVEAERTFAGHTIPSHLRVGWHLHAGRFASDGEFFRVIVDDAAYR